MKVDKGMQSDFQINDVYRSTSGIRSEESDEEQNNRISELNDDTEMVTALQKNHLEVMDILRLKLEQNKDKNNQLAAMLQRQTELLIAMKEKHRVCKCGHAIDRVGGDLHSEPGKLTN